MNIIPVQARVLNSINVDASNGVLTVELPDYTGKGLFSINATDINGEEEAYIDTDYQVGFDPQLGLATISGSTPLDNSHF